MNSLGSSNIQGTTKKCLLVKPHLSISMHTKTYRQNVDISPERIPDKTEKARDWPESGIAIAWPVSPLPWSSRGAQPG